jgi:MFS family permease
MYITVREPAVQIRRPSLPAGSTARRRVPRTVWLLGAVSLLTDISSESVTAVLPLYLTVALGLSPAAYGVIDGLNQGVSALVRVAGGWSADRSGHPKWVALVGYGSSCVARVGLVFAAGLGAVTAVVVADRLGKGIRTAPRDAIIARVSPPEDLGRSFGVHRALDTTGAAIGPVIAFLVLWLIPDGYLTVMVISVGFAALGVLVLGLFVQEPPDDRTVRPRQPRSFRWRDAASPRQLRMLLVAGLLGLLTVGDGFLYLALLDGGDLAVHWFPLLYVGTNVAFLALAVPLGRLSDRRGRAPVLLLGYVALVMAYLTVARSPGGIGSLVAALVLLGTFYAATDGVLTALAARLAPASARATGIALAQTVVALTRMVSAMGFGLLWLAWGAPLALSVVAVALAAVLPPAFLVLRRLDRAGAAA